MKETLLSKPKHGWTTFSLGNKEYNLSYLTPVPIDWLNAAIYGLSNLTPFAVHGFCEPGRFLCLVSYWNCHIIFEDDEREMLVKDEIETDMIHISMLDFCKKLYADINNNINDWCNWDNSNDENTIKDMKSVITPLLDKLLELIAQTEEHFAQDKCFL